MKRVAIVGLGLIGGSVAKALRRAHGDVFIVAVDRDDVGKRSDVRDVVSEFVSIDAVLDRTDMLTRCELVVLCQPVHGILESLSSYLALGSVVTDTGSTKRRIVRQAALSPNRASFIAGHPMAGRAQGGFEHSSADLFDNRPWILCPDGSAPEAVRRAEELVETVGATSVLLTAEQHDAAVAVTSHVPQILSSWLHRAASDRHALSAAGPAFRDMTRTAGGSEAIWRDIFDTNADQVGFALRDAAIALAAVADALLDDPPRVERVLELLRQARASKAAGPNRSS